MTCMQRHIARSYVLLENGASYTLEYGIFSEPAQDGGVSYGVSIIQREEGRSASESAIISQNEERALHIITLFAKNFVFPVSLRDLAEDMELYQS